MDYRIFPPDALMEFTATMPPSKSETNRALIINALTPGAPLPVNPAQCDDSTAIVSALASPADTINIGAAGTAMRFLTAYFAAIPGRTVTLDGSERMRMRPIGPLVDALRQCGAQIEYVDREGFPPLRITGQKLTGGNADVNATISSQFVSALMMIAPLMEQGLHLELDGELASAPYVHLTARLMRQAGIEIDLQPTFIHIAPQSYIPTQFKIGGDWSAASYWYEIQALTCGFSTLIGLDIEGAQADSVVARFFEQLGVITSSPEDPVDDGTNAIELSASPEQSPRLTLDFADSPDILQTLAVTAVMLGVPFRFTGAQSLRIKETDRIEALKNEMLKIGAVLSDNEPGTLEWDGSRRPVNEIPEFDTYSDHRMAMALAPVALYIPGIIIRDIHVVEKSYPDFWKHLEQIGFTLLDPLMPMEEVEKILAERQCCPDE